MHSFSDICILLSSSFSKFLVVQVQVTRKWRFGTSGLFVPPHYVNVKRALTEYTAALLFERRLLWIPGSALLDFLFLEAGITFCTGDRIIKQLLSAWTELAQDWILKAILYYGESHLVFS